MKVLLFLLALTEICFAIETGFGGCPRIRPLTGSELDGMNGTWYDIKKHPSIFIKGKCMTIDVNVTSQKTISIVQGEFKSGEYYNMTRRGKIDDSGAMEFEFTFLNLNIDLFVLDSDVDNYMVGFACESVSKIANAQMAWIFGRNPVLHIDYIQKAEASLHKYGISTKNMKISEQFHCL
jgi:lipocalin